MKKLLIFVAIAFIGATFSCTSNTKRNANNNNDSIMFDSIKIDSTLSLSSDTGSHCHIKLCMTFATGKNAEKINEAIVNSGILSSDFMPTVALKNNIPGIIDSFVTNYLKDYKDTYEELYDANTYKEYNCEYDLKTHIEQNSDKYYTYVASVYAYSGGAHGSTLTINKNIDAKSGKVVLLKDLFVPGYEKALNDIIIKTLCEKYKVKNLTELQEKTTIFSGIDAYAPENFIIKKNSIIFIYSSDEIACHAIGEICVEVKNDVLKDLLKK